MFCTTPNNKRTFGYLLMAAKVRTSWFLRKYTDFHPQTEIKTWQQGSLTRGPDILSARSSTDWRNVIPTDPRFDTFENIKRVSNLTYGELIQLKYLFELSAP